MHMTESYILVYGMYIGISVFSALALSLFITYMILNKNNNFGDFAPDIEEYSLGGIHYTREVNNVTSQEKKYLFLEYGENPYENRQHNYPEQLLQKPENDQPSEEDLL